MKILVERKDYVWGWVIKCQGTVIAETADYYLIKKDSFWSLFGPENKWFPKNSCNYRCSTIKDI